MCEFHTVKPGPSPGPGPGIGPGPGPGLGLGPGLGPGLGLGQGLRLSMSQSHRVSLVMARFSIPYGILVLRFPLVGSQRFAAERNLGTTRGIDPFLVFMYHIYSFS